MQQEPNFEKLGRYLRNVGLAMALSFVLPALVVWIFIALVQAIVEMKKAYKSYALQELRDGSNLLIGYLVVASIALMASASGFTSALVEYLAVLQPTPDPYGWQTIVYLGLYAGFIPLIAGGFACAGILIGAWMKVSTFFKPVGDPATRQKGESGCRSHAIAQLFTMTTSATCVYIVSVIGIIHANLPPYNTPATINSLLMSLVPAFSFAALAGLVSVALQIRGFFTAGSAFQLLIQIVARPSTLQDNVAKFSGSRLPPPSHGAAPDVRPASIEMPRAPLTISPIPEEQTCMYCGNKIKVIDGIEFCPLCGNRMGKE